MTNTTDAKIAKIRNELRKSDDSNLRPLADKLTDEQIKTLRDAFRNA